MKADDFKAVIYEGKPYHLDCLPENVDPTGNEADPIFVTSEWEEYPICEVCHKPITQVVFVGEDEEADDYDDEDDFDEEAEDYDDEDDFDEEEFIQGFDEED